MDKKDEKRMMLNTDQLTELAKDPQNIVYHFKDRAPLPQSEVVPIHEVRDKITRLYTRYKMERRLFIERKKIIKRKQWNYIKAKILKDPEWARFNVTHPIILDRVLHPETTDREIKTLMFMIFLREKQDAGEITDGLESLKEYVFSEFAVSKEEHEAQQKKKGFK